MPRERGPVVLFRSGYDTLSALEFHPFPRLFRDMQAFVTALTERARTRLELISMKYDRSV